MNKQLKLRNPDAYQDYLKRHVDIIDGMIDSMKNDLIIHQNSSCNPSRTRYLELCLEMANKVRTDHQSAVNKHEENYD